MEAEHSPPRSAQPFSGGLLGHLQQAAINFLFVRGGFFVFVQQAGGDPQGFDFLLQPKNLFFLLADQFQRIPHVASSPLDSGASDLAGSLPTVNRRAGGQIRHEGTPGALTRPLVPGVVGVAFHDGKGAVDLFEQNDPGQFVGQRHLSQGKHCAGGLADYLREPVG